MTVSHIRSERRDGAIQDASFSKGNKKLLIGGGKTGAHRLLVPKSVFCHHYYYLAIDCEWLLSKQHMHSGKKETTLPKHQTRCIPRDDISIHRGAECNKFIHAECAEMVIGSTNFLWHRQILIFRAMFSRGAGVGRSSGRNGTKLEHPIYQMRRMRVSAALCPTKCPFHTEHTEYSTIFSRLPYYFYFVCIFDFVRLLAACI